MLVANVLQAYRPIGPRPLTSAVEVRAPFSSSLASEMELPSWLPNVSRPRFLLGRHAPPTIDSGPDRVNWAGSKCFGRLRHVLSFSARPLGTVVMTEGFPPTWKRAVQTITAFLKQATVEWTLSGKSAPEFANDIESRVESAMYIILRIPIRYRTDYIIGTNHEETGSEHLSSVVSTQQKGGDDSSESADKTVQDQD